MAQKQSKKKKKGILGTIGKAFLGDVENGEISVTFFSYVMILIVVGLVMMSSASYVWANEKEGDGLYYAKKQIFAALIGFAAMIFFARMDYHNFKKIKIPGLQKFNIAGLMYVIGLGFLILVLIMGTDEGGSMSATRWLVIGPINFQPSEIAKFTIVIFFAYRLERKSDVLLEKKAEAFTYVLLLAPYAILIGIQPHLSGCILICVIAASIVMCGGADKKLVIAITIGGIALIAGIIKWQAGIEGSYVAVRLESLRDPFADVLNDTWQTANSLIAIGSGGLFGLGFGNSRQKYLYLPEAQNDFIFPIVCEELGFVGAFAIILVFFLLIVEGYSIAARCQDKFGMFIAVGFTTHIGIQTILNLAVVSNTIPNTGISLPFFSYGGTALIMQMAEMGIILNISRKRYYPDEDGESDEAEKNEITVKENA